MAGLKESGQAVGAQALTRLTGFAPPTVLQQAARLQSRQRFFNLTVTNVPGPQFPLYVLGRRLEALYPQVPLVLNTALGIAIMSYDGASVFGLLGDYDALPDLDALAADLDGAIDELAAAAGVRAATRGRSAPRRVRATAASATPRAPVSGLLAGVVGRRDGVRRADHVLASRDRSAVGGEDTIGTLRARPRRATTCDGPRTPAAPQTSRRRAARTGRSRSSATRPALRRPDPATRSSWATS